MLDRLPSWLRYLLVLLLIAPLAGGVGALAVVVTTSGDVFAIDWQDTGRDSINVIAVTAASGATGYLAMFVLPITRKFGVGKNGAGYDAGEVEEA